MFQHQQIERGADGDAHRAEDAGLVLHEVERDRARVRAGLVAGGRVRGPRQAQD